VLVVLVAKAAHHTHILSITEMAQEHGTQILGALAADLDAQDVQVLEDHLA
jgi:hypothetical protein